MEIIISTKDHKVSLSTDVEICESERKKFDKNSNLIRNMQIDCHLEVSRVKNILKITRTAGEWVNETDIKKFEKDVKSFVSALAKMPITRVNFIPIPSLECPSHEEQQEVPEKEVKFVKSLIEDKDVIYIKGLIFCESGFAQFRTTIDVWKRIVNAYLEKYDKH